MKTAQQIIDDKINSCFEKIYKSETSFCEYQVVDPLPTFNYSDETLAYQKLDIKTHRVYHTAITHDGVKKEGCGFDSFCTSPEAAARKVIREIRLWIEEQLDGKKPPYTIFWRQLPEVRMYIEPERAGLKTWYAWSRLSVISEGDLK